MFSVIIRDDEDAPCSLDATGQELKKVQIQADYTKDFYWGVIEKRSNNHTLQLHLNMLRKVDKVDLKGPRISIVSASFLKKRILTHERHSRLVRKIVPRPSKKASETSRALR